MASIKLTLENLPSQNVITRKLCASDAVVVLVGHFDLVPGLSGANDNASGIAVLMAIAELLGGAAAATAALLQSPEFAELIENR